MSRHAPTQAAAIVGVPERDGCDGDAELVGDFFNQLRRGGVLLENGKDSSEKARNLLQDSDSWIKNRFALHLAKAGDKAAVTELIRSIGSLESQNCYESEEFLQNISRITPPANLISAKTPRKELESFWSNWWSIFLRGTKASCYNYWKWNTNFFHSKA